MLGSGRSNAASFWRCGQCGTPNPWKTYLTNCVGCGAPRPPRPAKSASASGETNVAVKAEDEVIKRPWTIGDRWLAIMSCGYAVLVVLVLAIIQWLSDRWWPATLLLYMPRGLFLIPILILAAWAGWLRRKKLWALHGVTALVVLVPLMGLSVPLGQLANFHLTGPRLRIMTFNQGNAGISAYKLISMIEHQNVQILCFQEGYTGQEGVADPILEPFLRGWNRNKERTIATKLPILEELPSLDNPDGEEGFWRARVERVRVRAPSGAEFIVAAVHMPSMFYALNGLMAGNPSSMPEHIAWRAQKMGLVAAILSDTQDLPLLVGGDFNMPSDSTMMSALSMPGLHYAFDAAGWGFGYTRPSSFPWVRIDHVLATPEFTFTRCWVGSDVGSDHLPLLAEVIVPDPADHPKPVAPPEDPTPPGAAPPVTPPVSASPDARRPVMPPER